MSKKSTLFVVATLTVSLVFAGCRGVVPGSTTPTPVVTPPTASLSSINHIIFMFQENRSFDHYFGKLNDYRAANGYPGTVDGLPASASNPSFDGTTQVSAFHMVQKCSENLSAAWNESHVQYNRTVQNDSAPATNDGFVYVAGKFARENNANGVSPQYRDTEGLRAMGFYDGSDLPYYYFMASNFATSDRWFAPAPTRTQPNRMYALAATSEGHAYPPNASLTSKTIFQALEEKGVSWKVYETEAGATYMKYFNTFYQAHTANFVSVDQYKTDAANGTLPAVALIESGYETAALDEHPQNDIQKGAAFVAGLMNTLMTSQSWKDSVFILTFDEAGGFYDHVAPMAPVPNPDGIPPSDLPSTDIKGDFTRTTFRVPLVVIGPYVKKNFGSHTSTH